MSVRLVVSFMRDLHWHMHASNTAWHSIHTQGQHGYWLAAAPAKWASDEVWHQTAFVPPHTALACLLSIIQCNSGQAASSPTFRASMTQWQCSGPASV